jgi:hypothetical protein
MNTMDGNRRYRFEKRQVKMESESKTNAFAWFFILFLVIVLGAGMGFLRLRNVTDDQVHLIKKKQHDIKINDKEIDNLKLDKETFTRGEYIKPKVNQMKMGLRDPQPGQVHRMPMHSGTSLRTDFTSDHLAVSGKGGGEPLLPERSMADDRIDGAAPYQ